jgi:hypothetical protein
LTLTLHFRLRKGLLIRLELWLVAGAAFTVTVVPALAALWQPEHLSLERYMFPVVLKSIGLFAPVDHKYELPALELTLHFRLRKGC